MSFHPEGLGLVFLEILRLSPRVSPAEQPGRGWVLSARCWEELARTSQPEAGGAEHSRGPHRPRRSLGVPSRLALDTLEEGDNLAMRDFEEQMLLNNFPSKG